ncbi:MAG: agmatinase [Solirubrobacterales bacterium]|nr:agmatinase [Solirubrobacterales bacterium]MCB0859891.1 agmatinase [Solirubrobacterales bacterium]MCB0862789.1 agmatinase [Solirubrobacterales bacterium]
MSERDALVAGEKDPTMWSSLLHAGLSNSFLRLPHVPADAEALREHGAKAAIYGIPFDATNISRTGANYGPRGIRDVSCQFLTFNATLGFDLLEALNPVDAGDTDIVLANAEKTFARAQSDLGEIIASGALPVTLGGDHSITIPAARAIVDAHDDPGLVLIDMHLDTAPDVGGELLNHCCPITRAVDAGFDPQKIALVGISGWMNPKTELQYCLDHGITVIWLEEIWEKGTRWAADKAREVAGAGDGIYLSFDIDSLDAAHAPGTCCPSPGGLTSREGIELVRGVSSGGLLGVDVVEVAPSLDSTPATALIGGRIALEAMAFHAGATL